MARQTSKTASKSVPGRLGPGGPLIGRRSTPIPPKAAPAKPSPRAQRIAKRQALIDQAVAAMGEAEI